MFTESRWDFATLILNCFSLTRRVNQRYLVATSTKLDISKVSVPENINDKYFAR